MRKSYLLFIVFLLAQCISLAQTNQKIVFIFENKEKLQEIFINTDADKIVNFNISGISSDKDAEILVAKFYSFSNKIKNFQIKDANTVNIREAAITLDKTVRLSYFTKLLINFEIRDVIAGGNQMKTEKLNDL
jgi:hypothetical protein